jgi:putative ABC transport system permease protein
MRKLKLYFRLAFTNIKANYRLYVPYLLASTGMIAMFYIILMLAMDGSIGKTYLGAVLGSGSYVVYLFSIAFILYINSFLMRRRTREFGIYNILGMDKPQIACVVFAENLLSYVVSGVGGILLGTLFSKLIQLLLLRLIQYGGNIQMRLNPEAALMTLSGFAVIYVITYIDDLRRIWKTKPIDMLESANSGEKEPKAKWAMSIMGVITLGAGYFLSQFVQDPSSAFAFFFIAVALVMIGTYLLFTTGSIAILKILKKNRKYYYQKNHFINVSGMMYRMKQNAKGLAQICILSCMVLVTVSMTVSLYVGVDSMVESQYARDIVVESYVTSQSQLDEIRSHITETADNDLENEVYYSEANVYISGRDGTYVTGDRAATDATDYSVLYVLNVSDFNRITGKNIQLQDGEVGISTSDQNISGMLAINDTVSSVKKIKDEIPSIITSDDSEMMTDNNNVGTVYLLCNDPFAFMKSLGIEDDTVTLTYQEAFDSSLSKAKQEDLCSSLNSEYFKNSQDFDGHANSQAAIKQDYYEMYGGFLFVGIFLGGIFLMATVLIIYYKQVSEGYEDRRRYRILEQVGLSRKEVHRSINAQVLTVFFLPLAVAMLHIFFAFHMIYELMLAFGLNDVGLFFKCMLITAGIFAVIYTLVYWITSQVYSHIVDQQTIN